MKMQDIIIDSIKYPLSGIKQLFLSGILILLTAFLLGKSNEFYDLLDMVLENVNLPDELILVISLLIFVLIFILTFLEAGYSFKIVEKSIHGEVNPPKFNNIISIIRHGLNETVIALIYFIVPIILLLAALGDIVAEFEFDIPLIPDDIAFLLIILFFITVFISGALITVAIPHMVSKGGAIREAFRFKEIFKKIMQIGVKKLIVSYMIVIIGFVTIGGPILEEIISTANLYGFIIAQLVIAPYILMFYARFISLIYNS